MTAVYLKMILLFSPAFILNNIINCFVRNDGNPGLSMAAMLAGSFLSPSMIAEMTCAGGLMILALGLNLTGITKIKVADYLPAILFAPVIYNIVALF